VLPGLATSWRSLNGSTWQYVLRQGVTFHDGTVFNATDVVYSIKNTIAWGGGDAPDVWATFLRDTIVSPYVIDLTFTIPVNAPIITSACYAAFIFSHNIVKYAGVSNNLAALHSWFNQYHDDGSGPYIINSTGSSLTGGTWSLYAYKNYWGGWKVGQVKNIIFKYISNVVTAINLAEAGQLDVIGISGNFQYVPSLLSSGLKVVTGPTHGSIWLLFNTQHPVLNNPLVRQALLTAVNYQQIVQEAYYGYGINWCGMINPGLNFYDSSAPCYSKFPTGDLTTAKALLVKAGYPNGVITPSVTWTLTYSTGSPYEATIASLLNTYWQPLGVTISITGLTFTNQAIKAGYVANGSAFLPGPISYASSSSCQDLALLNWNGATADPWLVADEFFAIQPAPYQNDILYNWTYWQNSTFTNLLNKFASDEVTNPTQAAADVKTLNLLWSQGAPGAAMYQGENVWVVSPHWTGIDMNPNYSFDYYFYYQWTYKP
jgi:peptide/nickel transport system substrate-binding protein